MFVWLPTEVAQHVLIINQILTGKAQKKLVFLPLLATDIGSECLCSWVKWEYSSSVNISWWTFKLAQLAPTGPQKEKKIQVFVKFCASVFQFGAKNHT